MPYKQKADGSSPSVRTAMGNWLSLARAPPRHGGGRRFKSYIAHYMNLQILYEDDNLLAVNKPAGVIVYPEGKIKEEETLIPELLSLKPELKKLESPRYGIAHRLDKETSGVLLVAKNNKALSFLQKQFKNREIEKRYLALISGHLKIKERKLETLIGRSPNNRLKQKVFLPHSPDGKGKRKAITSIKVIDEFKDYSLIEAKPKTGRKHQIRVHLSYLSHPIVGDKVYGFEDQKKPANLERQFLHASSIKFRLLNKEEIEIKSKLPNKLKQILNNLNHD